MTTEQIDELKDIIEILDGFHKSTGYSRISRQRDRLQKLVDDDAQTPETKTRSVMIVDVTPTVEDWIALMERWPSDGWDGAAEVIATHARKVNALMKELDRTQPGWRDTVKGKWAGYAQKTAF